MRRKMDATLLFVFIGAQPCTGWLLASELLDDHGCVHTGPSADGDEVRQLFETSRLGVLAVGDLSSGSIKPVASAVGEGAMAVRLVHENLARTDHVPGR